jgi:inner membrane protein
MNKPLFYKIISLCGIMLLLSIALSTIESKINERSATRDAAVSGIAQQFATEQVISGPIIWLECEESTISKDVDTNGKPFEVTTKVSCSRAVRPTKHVVDSQLSVNERYRGIYKARVYNAKLRLQDSFPQITLKANQRITHASLDYGVSDARGIKSIEISPLFGKVQKVQSSANKDSFGSGFHVDLDVMDLLYSTGFDVQSNLEVAGTSQIHFLPVGETNDISLSSSWPHPNFTGNFLPDAPVVNEEGFKARWRINDFATGGDVVLNSKDCKTLGVALIDPLDGYTQSNRAVKYGFMFVLLTFGGFFLFELVKQARVHPIQYLFIGLAVSIFFLLLVALSEHIQFKTAYLIAALACVLLISGYGRSILESWKAGFTLMASYSLLYLGMYQLLASEDYAFMLGAWLMFGALAFFMFLTRRLNWYQVDQKTNSTPSS